MNEIKTNEADLSQKELFKAVLIRCPKCDM